MTWQTARNSILWGLFAAAEEVVMGRSVEPLEVVFHRAQEAIRPHDGRRP